MCRVPFCASSKGIKDCENCFGYLSVQINRKQASKDKLCKLKFYVTACSFQSESDFACTFCVPASDSMLCAPCHWDDPFNIRSISLALASHWNLEKLKQGSQIAAH